jgi:L-fuculose-phosphate aldolase
MNEEPVLRHSIVEIGRLMYDRKMVIAADGNISVRLDAKHILITPAGFCKGFLSEADVVRLPIITPHHPSGPPLVGASSETPMHVAIYLARPEIGAVVHAHPPYATSFAVSGARLDHELLTESGMLVGPIGRVPRLKPGSLRLASAVARALRRCDACLLGHHGGVTLGRDLLEAYYRLERLEFLAQVSVLSNAR